MANNLTNKSSAELAELLERVKAAKRPSYDLDLAIEQAVGPFPDRLVGAYSQSVDEALALVARVLPDTVRVALVQQPDRTWEASMLRVESDDADCPVEAGRTAPLAILAALLTALKGHSPHD